MFFNKKNKKIVMSNVESYDSAQDLTNEVLRTLNAKSDKSIEYFYARFLVEDVFICSYALSSADNYFASNAYCYMDTIIILDFLGCLYMFEYEDRNSRAMGKLMSTYRKCMKYIIKHKAIFNIEEEESLKIYADRMYTYSSMFEESSDLGRIVDYYTRLVYFESQNKELCMPLSMVPVELDIFDEEKTRIRTYINNAIVEMTNKLVELQKQNVLDFLDMESI